MRSDLARRQTRNSLALVLGRPSELSADLEMPDLTVYARREIPEYHELVDQVISGSPTLEALRHQIGLHRHRWMRLGKRIFQF